MRAIAATALVAAVWAGGVSGQEPPPAPAAPVQETQPVPLATPPEKTQPSAAAPCIKPVPMVRWEDYEGPFQKTVGLVGRRLDRRSTYAPAAHYKPGAALCVLTLHDKFILSLRDMFDPVTFLGIAYTAGISQAENNDPSYGQGAAGYGTRFGAGMAGQATSLLFKDLLYPTIFSQDPRYYRLGTGSTRKRFLHALEHSVVAYRENGTQTFNFTEWLGTTSAIVLSNTYHPDNRRGVGPAASRLGSSIGGDMGYDVLREFWPEIARRFRLPFRGQNEPVSPGTSSEKK
jgi:hypothetical protein